MNTHVVAIFPGWGEWLVVAVLVAFPVALIFAVVWFAKMAVENKQENVRLRLEVGKIANELELVRKQQHPQ